MAVSTHPDIATLVDPLFAYGGKREKKRKTGTLNHPGIAALVTPLCAAERGIGYRYII